MHLAAQVLSAQVDTKKGTGKNGKPYEIHTQNAFIDLNHERRRIQVPSDPSKPYPVGKYVIDLNKYVRVGRFNNLELDDRVTLDQVPVKA